MGKLHHPLGVLAPEGQARGVASSCRHRLLPGCAVLCASTPARSVLSIKKASRYACPCKHWPHTAPHHLLSAANSPIDIVSDTYRRRR